MTSNLGDHQLKRPEWLKAKLPAGPNYADLVQIMRAQGLHTVCEEARCPNIGDCWERRTATFLALGNLCTRNCAYCAIAHGLPTELDLEEPERVARAVQAMGLRHAAITSVNHDDLADGGAGIFAAIIARIHQYLPECTVAVLLPDFTGDAPAPTIIPSTGPILARSWPRGGGSPSRWVSYTWSRVHWYDPPPMPMSTPGRAARFTLGDSPPPHPPSSSHRLVCSSVPRACAR